MHLQKKKKGTSPQQPLVDKIKHAALTLFLPHFFLSFSFFFCFFLTVVDKTGRMQMKACERR